MGLLDTIDSITETASDTVSDRSDNITELARTGTDFGETYLKTLATLFIFGIAVVAFLIIFALDSTYAIILAVLAIVAIYLLNIDLGRGRNSSGPRQ